MRPALRDDVLFAAEVLAAREKMINAVQVTAVLRRAGVSVTVDSVRAVLYAFTAEQPPRLVRAVRVVGDGPTELIQYFVLTPPSVPDRPRRRHDRRSPGGVSPRPRHMD